MISIAHIASGAKQSPPSESQHGLGQDILLDLVGPAIDRGSTQEKIALGRLAGPGGPEFRLVAERLQLLHPIRLAGLLFGVSGDDAELGDLERLDVSFELGDAQPKGRVVDQRLAVGAHLVCRLLLEKKKTQHTPVCPSSGSWEG